MPSVSGITQYSNFLIFSTFLIMSINGQLLDATILEAFPALLTVNQNGQFPTIVYKHSTEQPADGGDPIIMVGTARVIQRMDGSHWLLRKRFPATQEDLNQFPEGSIYKKAIYLLETTSEQIAGGEPVMDPKTMEVKTSNGKQVKRLVVADGDQIGINLQTEIVPGITVANISYQTINIKQDIRLSYDRTASRQRTKTPSATDVLNQSNT